MRDIRIGICPICGDDIRLDPDGAYCKSCDTYLSNEDLKEIGDDEYKDSDCETDWFIDNALAQYRANIDGHR